MKKKILIAYGVVLLILTAVALLGNQDILQFLVGLKWLPLSIGILFMAFDKRKYMLMWKIFAILYSINFLSIPFAFLWTLEFLGLKSTTHTPDEIYAGFAQALSLFIVLPAIVLLIRFVKQKNNTIIITNDSCPAGL